MSMICSFASIPLIGFISELDSTKKIVYNSTQFNTNLNDTITPLKAMINALISFSKGDHWPMILLIICVIAYCIEYGMNFIVVSYVSPIVFSVIDIARRLAIILTGSIVFHKSLTVINCLGIFIAMFGVGWYSNIERKIQENIKNKENNISLQFEENEINVKSSSNNLKRLSSMDENI
jgi:drug/metabolite transporter (DMT)-like permease